MVGVTFPHRVCRRPVSGDGARNVHITGSPATSGTSRDGGCPAGVQALSPVASGAAIHGEGPWPFCSVDGQREGWDRNPRHPAALADQTPRRPSPVAPNLLVAAQMRARDGGGHRARGLRWQRPS